MADERKLWEAAPKVMCVHLKALRGDEFCAWAYLHLIRNMRNYYNIQLKVNSRSKKQNFENAYSFENNMQLRQSLPYLSHWAKTSMLKNPLPKQEKCSESTHRIYLLLLLVLEKVLLIYTKNFQGEFSLIKGTTLLEWFKRPGPVRKNEKLNLMEEDRKYQPLLGGYCIFVKRRRFGSAIKKDPLFPFYHNERPTLICEMLFGIFSGLFVLATCFFSAEGISFLPLLLSCMPCVLV